MYNWTRFTSEGHNNYPYMSSVLTETLLPVTFLVQRKASSYCFERQLLLRIVVIYVNFKLPFVRFEGATCGTNDTGNVWLTSSLHVACNGTYRRIYRLRRRPLAERRLANKRAELAPSEACRQAMRLHSQLPRVGNHKWLLVRDEMTLKLIVRPNNSE